MISLDLVVDLDPSIWVNGQASYQCIPIQKAVDSAFFDAVDITIHHILLDDDTLQFTYVEGGVMVHLPRL